MAIKVRAKEQLINVGKWSNIFHAVSGKFFREPSPLAHLNKSTGFKLKNSSAFMPPSPTTSVR